MGIQEWECNGTAFSGCHKPKDWKSDDIYGILYHCDEHSFDLCEGCARHYMRKKEDTVYDRQDSEDRLMKIVDQEPRAVDPKDINLT